MLIKLGITVLIFDEVSFKPISKEKPNFINRLYLLAAFCLRKSKQF